MSGLGGTVVNLGMNTDKFKKGIGSAQSGLKSFASGATALLNPITIGLAAMTAGAVAAGGALWGITNRISGLAGIADKAVQTGLSGEFLQRLGYAADQSGVSIETLTGGVKKLTIAIGNGDAKPFEEIGLSLKDLQALSPDQQFMKVAEAIGKIPTAAGRAAAAVKIFGKSGIDMTGLFAGGLDDINKLLTEAKAIGIGVSEEDLKRAAIADDAFQRMKASFGALIDKVSVVFAPALTDIADKITGMIAPVNLLMDKFNAMPDKFKFLGEVIVAAFDLGFAHIKANWLVMLDDMLKDTIKFANTNSEWLHSPIQAAAKMAGRKLGEIPVDPNAGVKAAQEKMAGLMARLNAPLPGPAGAGNGGMPGRGAMLGGAGARDRSNDAFVGPQRSPEQQFGQWLKGMLPKAKDLAERGKMLGGGMVGLFKGIGTGTANQSAPQFAGAMQKGSAEAYSTILASMRGGKKDPVVTATEKQTKDLLKGLKPSALQMNMVPEFVV